MQRLATMNQKGGAGKTTTAVNLAAALGEVGRRVLLIDVDPQANASHWLGVRHDGRAFLDVLTGDATLASVIVKTGVPGVDIVAAGDWLVGAERALGAQVGAETVLRRKLAPLDGRWDHVIVDCPPALGILSVNALAAVDAVLIPVEAHVLALDGLAQLLRTIDVVRKRLNTDLRIAGIVVCRVDGRTRLSAEIVADLRTRFGDLVHATTIRENVRLAEAPSHALPITQYDTRSAGASDHRALAREVLAYGGRPHG